MLNSIRFAIFVSFVTLTIQTASAADLSGIVVLIKDSNGRLVPGLRFEHTSASCKSLLDTAEAASSDSKPVTMTFRDCFLNNGTIEGELVTAACFPVKTPVSLDMLYPLRPTAADESRLRTLWDRVRVVFQDDNFLERSQCN